MFSKRLFKSALVFVLLLVVIGFVLRSVANVNGISGRASSNDTLLNTLQQKSLVSANIYTASGVIPPTNRWFSSLAFQQPSNPVFALPLALKTTATGFSLGQPQISASANTVQAPFSNDIDVHVASQVKQEVTGYDDLSASFALTNQGVPQLSARLTRGSPYLFMNIKSNMHITLDSTFTISKVADQKYLLSGPGGLRYGFYADTSVNIQMSDQGLSISTDKNAGNVAVFAIAKDADPANYFDAAKDPITSTTVTNTIQGDKLATTYHFKTASGKDTLEGLLPFAHDTTLKAGYGSFDTLEGQQTVAKGSSFRFTQAVLKPNQQLDITKLTSSEKQQLKQYLQKDIASLKFTKNDTYFGGKEMYRAAQLLQMAHQLNMPDQADAVQTQLAARMSQWFDPAGYKTRDNSYFYYDNLLKGLVGVQSSFGSDAFNDHHFHYGYFLDAAAILSKYDSKFKSENSDFINLLTKDILNTDRSDTNFPYIRTFDQYIGHSWASGFGNFGDGQNQESSSEAVHAWSAAYNWAVVSDNKPLQTAALGLYNRESTAAQRQWLSKPPQAAYQHSIVPLVWSGKLDYATFFSDSPAAKLGIQLIPMSPASNYLNSSNSTTTPAPLAAMNTELGGAEPSQFKDYLLMYQAMFDPGAAQSKVSLVTAKDLDDGDSMSYFYAWMYSH